MRRDVQAIVLILVGGAVLRITIGDTFLNYVQEPMRPWLLLSGGILVVLGVLALIDSIRKGRAADDEATPHDEPHEHDDGHGHADFLQKLPGKDPRPAHHPGGVRKLSGSL